MKTITVRVSPSLALIKYWGKANTEENIPATSSLAVNLESFYTQTAVKFATDYDQVAINGVQVPIERYQSFFHHIRRNLATDRMFHAESRSNFPVAAGLASSSSGFAALAYGCAKLVNGDISMKEVSNLARLGSASASRALFGGFTLLRRGARSAEPFLGEEHWPELRIIVAIVRPEAKKISSRGAMEMARITSPYYSSWLSTSEKLFRESLDACRDKNLEKLGELMRTSYLGMFSTMFTSQPPIFYWEPESVQLIKICEELRQKGVAAWETMDAGPQVKILCVENDLKTIQETVQDAFPQMQLVISRLAGGPTL